MWSIDSWDTEAKLQAWETTYTPTWPDLLDNVTGTDTLYGITAAPTFVIIDTAGVVRFTHVGNPGSATLISEIQSLLPPPELSLQDVRTWYWTGTTDINSVARGDVDGDTQQEIVTGGYYFDGTRDVAQLVVWNGATMALERVKTWYWTDDTRVYSVAVGNVDGDGSMEIVTGGYFFDGSRSNAQLVVWNGATLAVENIKTWYTTSNTFIRSVAIGEVDADASVEIVTGGYFWDYTRYNAQLRVWTGASLAVEHDLGEYYTGSTYVYSVAVGNVDGDSAVEIVTGGSYSDGTRYNAFVVVWNGASLTPENFNSWYWTSHTYVYSVAVGDVDADGKPEIVTGGKYSDGSREVAQLVKWHGATLAVENVKTWYWTSSTVVNSVVAQDVDGDGQVEIVTGGHYLDGTRIRAQLVVWGGGSLAVENVRTWYWTGDTDIRSVVAGDVDADGKVEVVTGGYFYDGARNVAQLCVWT